MTATRKESIWIAAVIVAVLLLMVAEAFEVSALAFVPILLGMYFVGLWAFDVK